MTKTKRNIADMSTRQRQRGRGGGPLSASACTNNNQPVPFDLAPESCHPRLQSGPSYIPDPW